MNADTPQPSESVEATEALPMTTNDLIEMICGQLSFEEHKRVLSLVWEYRDSFAARAVAAAVKLKDEEIERLKHEGEEWMNVKNEILSDPEHWLSLANDRFNKDQADLTACRAQLASRDAEIKTLREALEAWQDCAEYGWTIIANASGGDWTKESADWQTAAAKFRDENYYVCLSKHRPYRAALSATEGSG